MKKLHISVIALFGSLSILGNARPAEAQNGDIAVIVNAINPLNSISKSELRKIFAGEKHNWSNGTPIKLLTRASGTREHSALLSLLGMNDGAYKQYWTTQIYRGEATAEPVVLPSNGMQREAVNAFPGAIALVDANDVKAGMKVLRVDGKSPGDPAYDLK